jgi:hypothetical protein
MAMFRCKLSKPVAAKAFIATLLLSALAGLAGSHIAPQVALHTVLLYCAIGAATVFTALVITTIAVLTVMQFILRKGGTDTQWLWFSADPPSLVELRQRTTQDAAPTAHEH